MFCESCGSKLEEGAKFCGNCGAPVNIEVNAKPDSESVIQLPPVSPLPSASQAEPAEPETQIESDGSGEGFHATMPVKKGSVKGVLILLICLCVVLFAAAVGFFFAWQTNSNFSGGGRQTYNFKKWDDIDDDDGDDDDYNGYEMTEEEAGEYVMACLDASYKGDFDDYLEWTDSSLEEAQAMYDSGIENTVNEASLAEDGVSQELQDKYRQLFIDLYKNAKYSISDIRKTSSGVFKVDLAVYSFAVFDGLEDAVIDQLINDPSYSDSLAEEQANEMAYQKMYDIVEAALTEYGEAKIVTISVRKNSDGLYYISENDYYSIEDALLPD